MKVFENFRIPGSTRKPGELYLCVQNEVIQDFSIYPPIQPARQVIDCNGFYLSAALFDIQPNCSLVDFDESKLYLDGVGAFLLPIFLNEGEILKDLFTSSAIHSILRKGACEGIHLIFGKNYCFSKENDIKEFIGWLKKELPISLISIWENTFSLEDQKVLSNSGLNLLFCLENKAQNESIPSFTRNVNILAENPTTISINNENSLLKVLLNTKTNINFSLAEDGFSDSFIKLLTQLKEDKIILSSKTLYNRNKNGSTRFSLLSAVKHLVRYSQVPISQALQYASLKPANLIQNWTIGKIAVGRKANLVLLNENLEVQQVYVGGKEKLAL